MFSRLSIKVKLTLITAVSSILALLCAAGGYLYYDFTTFQAKMMTDLKSEAAVIGANCAAAVAFRDTKAVKEVLESLRAQQQIRSAAIYTVDGKLFATYIRSQEHQQRVPLMRPRTTDEFQGDDLHVFSRVVADKDTVGYLFISSGLDDWYERRDHFTIILALLLVFCLGVAMLIGSGLQRMISVPIFELVNGMEAVTRGEHYKVSHKRGNDELGQLVDGFNTMLSELESRDADLHAANEMLETRVRERTEDLEREVAERKAAEDSLIKSQESLEDLFENATVGLHLLGPDGTILKANRAQLEMLGYEDSEYVGKSISAFHLDQSVVDEMLARLAAGETLQNYESRMRCKDGDVKVVSVESNVLWEDGAFVHARCFLRDMTAHQEAARAQRAMELAERANAAKNEFLSRMSHELRTPMNSILGFSQLLAMDELTEDQLDSVTQIVNAGTHLLKLINEVLDISRIETGNLAISNEPVNLSEVIKEITSLSHPLATQKSVTIISPGPELDDVHVHADRQRLSQVLINLVSNAIKYNVEFGEVELSVERSGDVVKILVSDTGPGISDENLSRIFTPFERLGAEQTTIEGTGLGLSLSKRLTEAMGGRIGILPRAKGACFFVELLATSCPIGLVRQDRLEASENEAALLGQQSTILLIEDNKANIRLFEKILATRTEYRLITSMQGGIGVELAREHRPNLVILDLNLPDITGEEVLADLRNHPKTMTIPVVIVSADATPSQIERLLHAGAVEYLTKPLNVEAFMSCVDKCCKPKVKKSA